MKRNIKIGLTMIVKDESKVIGRCLDAIFKDGIIDYFSIVDTGSTDNTKKIISEKALQYGIEGRVVDYPFTDFADCRNVSLDVLRGKVDYVLWIDADEIFKLKTNTAFTLYKDTIAQYEVIYVDAIQNGIRLKRNSIVKINGDMEMKIKWNGLVHEYLSTDSDKILNAEFCEIECTPEGNSWSNLNAKYNTYIVLLRKQIELEPNEPRWVYFLADTLRNLQKEHIDKLAVGYYEQRILMEGGNIEEVYISKVMSASLKKKLYNFHDYGLLESCPNYRAEHLLVLAMFYLSDGNIKGAYTCLDQARSFMGVVPMDITILVDPKTYYFTLPYLFAQVCFNLQNYVDAKFATSICKYHLEYATQAEKQKIAEIGNNCK